VATTVHRGTVIVIMFDFTVWKTGWRSRTWTVYLPGLLKSYSLLKFNSSLIVFAGV
jgi:hypothetical protein